MRSLSLILILILLGCNKTKTQKVETDSTEKRIKNEALVIAENYARSNLNNTVAVKPNKHGDITVSDSLKRYVIDLNSIKMGLIDGDNIIDAIVSMVVYYSNQTVTDEHLILLNKNGKLELAGQIEQNIRVILITNRKIIAELHTKPRSSILYQCQKCKKIVEYQFKDGDLVLLNQ
jgi:hypothetical protein